MKPSPRKAISLGFELSHITDALEGLRALLDTFAHDGFDSPEDARAVPMAAVAISNLVLLRLRCLCDIVRKDLDPATLWAPHNDASQPSLLDHDVRFEEWPRHP